MKLFHKITLWAGISLLGVSPAFPAAFTSEVDLNDTYTGVMRIEGSDNSGILGLWAASGDINGDGFDDAVICAQRNSPGGRSQAGEVFVFFGSGSFFDRNRIDLAGDSSMLTIQGEISGDELGASATLGDINNDGFADILIGAPGKSKAYIVFGSGSLPSQKIIDLSETKNGVVQIFGIDEYDKFGNSTFTADINGDGCQDAIIGAPSASPFRKQESGEICVIYGKQDWSAQMEIFLREPFPGFTRIVGGMAGDWLGVRAVGSDMNGDGFDDVVIGAFSADGETIPNCGKTFVVFGSSGMPQSSFIDVNTAASGVLTIIGEHADDYSGLCLSPINVDNDSYGDILVSAAGYDHAETRDCGISYIIRGSADLVSRKTINLSDTNSSVIKIYGEQQASYLSRGLTADINLDGFPDILVTATEAAPLGRDRAGKAWLLYGPLTGLGGEIDLAAPPSGTISFLGGQAGDYLGGFCVSGDFDHNGYPDMVIGSHAASPNGRTQAGKAYIISGKGIEKTPETTDTPFLFAENTGSKAYILLDSSRPPMINGQHIEIGDAIGVFTPSGLCAGAASWTGKDLLITVWGDDPQGQGINGFLSGERYFFRIYDRSESVILLTVASFSEGMDVFQVDEIFFLDQLAAGIISGSSAQKPAVFSLSQNFPNPFNLSTVIRFTIPARERVTLKIFNSLGEEVATLVQGTIDPGTYDVSWDAAGMASGQYFCRLQAGASAETRKLILLK